MNDQFQCICSFLKIDIPEKEYKFDKDRKWRADYAWPNIKLAVELEGGIYTKGRHVRGKGYENDLEKYNSMIINGWVLLRYTPSKINWNQIERVYKKLKNN